MIKLHVCVCAVVLANACTPTDSALFDDVRASADASQSGDGSTASDGGSTVGGGGSTASGVGSSDTAVAGGSQGGTTSVGGGASAESAEGGRAVVDELGISGGDGEGSSEAVGEGGGGAAVPVEVPEPLCGNGLIDPGEECDDAGLTGSDACMGCQVVCSLLGAGAVESKHYHCYRSFEEAPYDAAQAACLALGGHLATIADQEENELVRTLVASSNFIGASEDVSLMSGATGAYAWVTREQLVFTNWGQGEPNRDDGPCSAGPFACFEHCLAMIPSGTWEDHRCDLADGYVCEWEPPGQAR